MLQYNTSIYTQLVNNVHALLACYTISIHLKSLLNESEQKEMSE